MKKITFALIFVIAFFLRFGQLAETPPSLSHDEVAIGYNAWSILETGKDEYGRRFPLLFRSFDDYKLPGYIYLTSISEKIFGLNEFAVRFPSAFLGFLTVVVFYFLLKQFFKQEIIPLIGFFLLAINPWHVNFSRAAFETNASLFFIVLGLFFLIKCINNRWFLCLAVISFTVSVYFYYTARILTPILLIVFFLLNIKTILKAKKIIIVSFVIGLIFLLPILPQMFSSGLSRVNQVSIFEDKSLTNPYSEAIVRNNNSLIAKIIYNRRIAYFQQFVDNYLKNFSFDYYFSNGLGVSGLLYLWEAPFLFYGIYLLFKMQNKWKWLILVWFFSTPIVGGLTTGQPNALRTLPNVIPAVFFSSFGIYKIYEKIQNYKKIKIYLPFFFAIVLFFTIKFMYLYFDYNPNITSSSWGDGHKQLAQFLIENKNNYDSFYITGDYWRPYIYSLFYMKYPPSSYHKNGSISNFGNYYFGRASWDKEGIDFANLDLSSFAKKKTIFILSKNDFELQKKLIKDSKYAYKLEVLKQINGNFAKDVFIAVKLK